MQIKEAISHPAKKPITASSLGELIKYAPATIEGGTAMNAHSKADPYLFLKLCQRSCMQSTASSSGNAGLGDCPL